jgi:hypothetical protein
MSKKLNPKLENLFEEKENYSIEKFKEQIHQLKEHCKKCPEIADFVEVLFGLEKDSYADKSSEKGGLAECLSALLWEITGYDFCSSIANLYHFDAGWANELLFFIENYFLDDAYFALICTRSVTGEIEWGATYSQDDFCSQNPQFLIQAAKENLANRKKYEEVDYQDWSSNSKNRSFQHYARQSKLYNYIIDCHFEALQYEPDFDKTREQIEEDFLRFSFMKKKESDEKLFGKDFMDKINKIKIANPSFEESNILEKKFENKKT